jgi:ABC-type transport system involved in multi-copper enzyme maturation permease subunit
MKDEDKVQELLESLSPKPLPAELRKKLLSTAHRNQRKSQVMTPVLVIVFSMCCMLIALALFSDIMITNSENEHVSAIMDYFLTSEVTLEKDLQEIATELFTIEYDKSLNQWLIQHYRTKKKSAKLSSYQSIIEILKEQTNEK